MKRLFKKKHHHATAKNNDDESLALPSSPQTTLEDGNGGILCMDKYGFLIDEDGEDDGEQCSNAAAGSQNHRRGGGPKDKQKWEQMLYKKKKRAQQQQHQATTTILLGSNNSHQAKLKSYARRGLPDSLRQSAWITITGADTLKSTTTTTTDSPNKTYQQLVTQAQIEYTKMKQLEEMGDTANISRVGNLLETIERDIHRTFPRHYLFHSGFYDENDDDGENGNGMKNGGADQMIESDLGSEEDEIDDNGEEDDDGNGSCCNESSNNIAQVIEAKKREFNESIQNVHLNLSNNEQFVGLDCCVNGAVDFGSINNIKSSHNPNDGGGGGGELLVDFGKSRGSDNNNNSSTTQKQQQPTNVVTTATTTKEGSEALMELGHGQNALRNALRAYLMYDTTVGYCQGMNYIVAMFLSFLNNNEENAFWLLVVVMNHEPYKLCELFGEDMAGTHEVLYIAEKLIQKFLPDLYAHFEKEGVNISMFITEWLVTIYVSKFPFELVSRVWDCFLVEGWKVVYRVMLSLLEHASKDLMERRFEGILNYFCDFPKSVNGGSIMEGSLKIGLKRRHIQKYAKEWRMHASNGGGGGR